MKGKSTLALVGILFAAAMVVGMATTSAFSTPLVIASSATVDNQFGMFGHITLTQTDADGNLKSYIQTDNVIVNVGENCVAEMLFDIATSGTDPCDGASTPVYTSGNGINDDAFTFIAVGNASKATPPPAAAENDQSLQNENATSAPTTMTRQSGTLKITNSTGTGVGSKAIVTLSAVFESVGGISDVDESGIFDESTLASAGNMLARQTFDNIRLSAGDQLTVEWEITIGADS